MTNRTELVDAAVTAEMAYRCVQAGVRVFLDVLVFHVHNGQPRGQLFLAPWVAAFAVKSCLGEELR